MGNHEFDQGYDDLVNRVMAPYDVDDQPNGGAKWKYLGRQRPVQERPTTAALKDDAGSRTSATSRSASSVRSPSTCPSSSRPGGIADIEVTDIVDAANAEANELKADGADIVILLVHEGAATTSYASATDPASDFGKIVNGVDANVDAIMSGHTHLAYNHRSRCRPGWPRVAR